MSSKPDFKQKANELFLELTGKQAGEAMKKIEHTLEQMWSMGYRYAVANDWWQEREKCEHQGDVLYYLTDPLQYKCSKCGVYFK